jgi:hypothetical protein
MTRSVRNRGLRVHSKSSVRVVPENRECKAAQESSAKMPLRQDTGRLNSYLASRVRSLAQILQITTQQVPIGTPI